MDINVLVSGSLILAIGPSGFSAASGQAVANLGAIAIPNDPNLVLDYQYNPAANTISLRTVPLTQQQYQDAVFYVARRFLLPVKRISPCPRQSL